MSVISFEYLLIQSRPDCKEIWHSQNSLYPWFFFSCLHNLDPGLINPNYMLMMKCVGACHVSQAGSLYFNVKKLDYSEMCLAIIPHSSSPKFLKMFHHQKNVMMCVDLILAYCACECVSICGLKACVETAP